MRKKGQIGESMQWILRLLIASLLLFILLAQIIMLVGYTETPTRMELSVYQQRLLYGPHGVYAHEDGVRPGVVDLSRLTDQSLRDAYYQEVPRFAARLTLYEDADAYASGTAFRTAVHEPKSVDKSMALAAAGLTGPGGGHYEQHVLPVLYEKADGLGQGLLKIEVMRLT